MTSAAAAPDPGEAKLNLSRARVLLIDGTTQGLTIMGQLLGGFGVRLMDKCAGLERAGRMLSAETYDLIVVDADLPGPLDGFDLVRRLRRESRSPNQQAAIIVLCGHARMSKVKKSRDSGASLLIAKPVSPSVLAKRIQWLARDRRDFVDCGDIYAGPDRRFHEQPEPPDGVAGRRRSDPADAPRGPADAPQGVPA